MLVIGDEDMARQELHLVIEKTLLEQGKIEEFDKFLELYNKNVTSLLRSRIQVLETTVLLKDHDIRQEQMISAALREHMMKRVVDLEVQLRLKEEEKVTKE